MQHLVMEEVPTQIHKKHAKHTFHKHNTPCSPALPQHLRPTQPVTSSQFYIYKEAKHNTVNIVKNKNSLFVNGNINLREDYVTKGKRFSMRESIKIKAGHRCFLLHRWLHLSPSCFILYLSKIFVWKKKKVQSNTCCALMLCWPTCKKAYNTHSRTSLLCVNTVEIGVSAKVDKVSARLSAIRRD